MANRSTLALVLVGHLCCAAAVRAQTTAPATEGQHAALAAPRQVLMLEASTPKKATGYGRGILIREIVRQAVLMAARDELGLATRDQALREPFVAAGATQPAPVGVETGQVWENYRVSLTRTQNRECARLRLADTPLMLPEERVDWLALLDAAEQQSRGLMVRRLRQIGFTGQGRPWGDAQVPADVDTLLDQMDLVSQYLAVRRLHAELARQGDSEALLAGLVRGYAHLGVMTDYFWNATHKVYKARALLYAQRMVAHNPASASALRHRAYALALSGLQGLAEKDLKAASAFVGTDNLSPPPWLPMLDAFCRYDWQKLRSNDWPEPVRSLAALWALVCVEKQDGQLVTEMGQALVKRSPTCLRGYEALCEVAGVSLGHKVTMQGPEAMAKLLWERLRPLKDLPDSVRANLPHDREEYRRALARRDIALALVAAAGDASDAGEPSWGALGRMLEEANFTQIARRLDFIQNMWGLDQAEVAKFADEVLPAVEGHPLQNYLESYRYRAPEDALRLRKLFDAVRAPGVGFGIQRLRQQARACGMYDREAVQEIRSAMYDQKDQIAPEVRRLMMEWDDPKWKVWYARILIDVDPHSPHAMATLIRHDWDNVQDRLPQWKQDAAQQLPVLAALIEKLRQKGDDQAAIPLLETYLTIAPSTWPYEQLAAIYLNRGEEGMWLATMERRLKAPDYGLAHERARVDIAWHFMRKGEFQRALPYAEEAAQSWAGWAMWCAAVCHEGLGNWDAAETWVRRVSERYEDSKCDWYLWCRRTGWGDIDSARQLMEDFARQFAGPDASDQSKNGCAELLGWRDMLEGQPADALEHFRRSFRGADCYWAGMTAMMLAQHNGDVALRDDLAQRLKDMMKRCHDDVGLRFLREFENAWSGKGALQLPAVEKQIQDMGPVSKPMAWSMTAQHLFDTGRSDEARQCLQRVLPQPEVRKYGYWWAWRLAEEHGLDPVVLRGWPAPADRPRWQPPQTQASDEESPPASQPARPQAVQNPPPAPI